MLEEIAVVQKVMDGRVELTTRIKTTCNSCEQQSHCGTGILSRYLAPKPENLILACPFEVSVGQQVKIGVAEQAMLALAFFVYMMPILCLAISAVVLTLAFPGLEEGWLICLSLLSVAGYFGALKLAIQNIGWRRLEPRILAVIAEQPVIPVQNLS
ncbi:MAG: SoxR reducing system RseC family protein [Aestuariibacter sp.]